MPSLQDRLRLGRRQASPTLTTSWPRRRRRLPLHRLVSIEDVGIAVAFLAMDGAKLITGETFYIDGGYHVID